MFACFLPTLQGVSGQLKCRKFAQSAASLPVLSQLALGRPAVPSDFQAWQCFYRSECFYLYNNTHGKLPAESYVYLLCILHLVLLFFFLCLYTLEGGEPVATVHVIVWPLGCGHSRVKQT